MIKTLVLAPSLALIAASAMSETAARADLAPVLTLDRYLEQVRAQNTGVRGNFENAAGDEERKSEGELLLVPTLFANVNADADYKTNPQFFFGTYGASILNNYSAGISEQTPWGLSAKLSYGITYSGFTDFSLYPSLSSLVPGGAGALMFSANVTYTKLEISQPLFSNFLGAQTRAQRDAGEAAALASSYGERFAARASLTQAEGTYWRLALDRQAMAIQKEALERAKKIFEWNQKRARLGLADKSDALQAEALYKLRTLDVQSTQDELRSASHDFNSTRGVDSDEVADLLTELTPDTLEHLEIPKRAELRDDVKAAQQQSRAADLNAEIALQRDLPTLNLTASYALNGIASDLGQALTGAFSTRYPTITVGLMFQAPLALGTLFHARSGYHLDQVAAQLTYDRKIFEQEEGWKDLNAKLSESRKRFELSREIEAVQEAKLTREKERFEHGRSTTYQVLMFEQDFLQAQLALVRAQAEVLNVVAQMKLYADATASKIGDAT